MAESPFQHACMDFALRAKPISRYIPENKKSMRFCAWKLITSACFGIFSLGIILAQTVVIMMHYNRAPAGYALILMQINCGLTIAFATEALLKIFALGASHYFNDLWNVFDFTILAASITDVVLTSLGKSSVNFCFLRLFRLARIVRCLKQDSTMQNIMRTFMQSLKEIPYIGALVGTILSIYAIFGMKLFGNVAPRVLGINSNSNFQSLGNALLLLLRCATGESWQQVMLDSRSGSLCEAQSDMKGHQCGSDLAYPYFVSFILLTSFMVLNIFVAVIMDNFDYMTRDASILGVHHLPEFISEWAKYDPTATGRISYDDLCSILRKTSPPLGAGAQCSQRYMCQKLIRMNIPMDESGRVAFTATLFALVRDSLSIYYSTAEQQDEETRALREVVKKQWPFTAKKGVADEILPTNDTLGAGKLTVGKIAAGKLIYYNWKAKKTPKSLEPSLEDDMH